jgi:hypothetical protein
LLKDRHGAPAMVRFEKALMLAKFLGNKVQERRAVRGLAAAARIQVRRSYKPQFVLSLSCCVAGINCSVIGPSSSEDGFFKALTAVCQRKALRLPCPALL